MQSFENLAVVTVTTRNYLHRVHVLMNSVARFLPGAVCLTACVDDLDDCEEAGKGVEELVQASSMGLPRYEQLAFALNPTAMCCMLKAHIAKHALLRPGITRVLYLDNDMGLYRCPIEMLQLLEEHSMVLTPHHLQPIPAKCEPDESSLVHYGIFNAGIFALRKCEEACSFLQWWGDWLLDPRHSEADWGYDQVWLNYVPVYCPNFTILRDSGYNVAFWNLPQRPLAAAGESFTCGSSPLTVFHFSHFNESTPERLVHKDGITNLPPSVVTEALGRGIASDWERCGRSKCLSWGYGYGKWPDGSRILRTEREAVCAMWDELPLDLDLWSPSFCVRSLSWYKRIKAPPRALSIRVASYLRSLLGKVWAVFSSITNRSRD